VAEIARRSHGRVRSVSSKLERNSSSTTRQSELARLRHELSGTMEGGLRGGGRAMCCGSP
jgi:hypothetical protein